MYADFGARGIRLPAMSPEVSERTFEEAIECGLLSGKIDVCEETRA